MQLIDHPVPASLNPWVERLSWLSFAADEGMPVFAGARVHLGFPVEGEFAFSGLDGEQAFCEPACWGAMRQTGRVWARGGAASAWLVKLAGGVAPAVLGVAAEALAGRTLPLRALWPELGALPVDEAAQRDWILAQIRQALERRAERLIWTPEQSLVVMRTLDRMPVAQAADALGLSRATLERRVGACFGLPPKVLARIQRFYRSLEAIQASSDADLAAEVGFFDQSHLIAEFRRFSGMTPVGLRREASRAAEPFRLYDACSPADHGG